MALKVTISKVGRDEVLSELSFGKEARSRGILFGSTPDCDINVFELKEEHARLERTPQGYVYRDVGGSGFAIDGEKFEGLSQIKIKDGTRLLTSGVVVQFKRETSEARPESQAPSGRTQLVTPTGTQTSLQAMAHAALKDLSRYFLGEGHFKSPGEIRRFKALLQLTLEVGIEWMSSTLHGRSEFQDQFSAPVTQLYHRTLNPLKGMENISTIAGFLLDWREERDIEGIRTTLRDAFDDMVKHQVGLLAGVQHFVEVLTDRLNPDRIKSEAGSGLWSNSKKVWDRYEELYGSTFAESSKLFNELIYPSIRKGYIFSHDNIQTEPELPARKGGENEAGEE